MKNECNFNYTLYHTNVCIVTFPEITEMYRNHGGCPCVCESPACVTYELI